MAAGVLSQTQQLLLEAPEEVVDSQALVDLARQRACGSCPCRKSCKDREKAEKLPGEILDRELRDTGSLPFSCRKSGRLFGELRRSQEQLRSLRGDHRRRREYRWAMIQQYRFLSEYLRDLADQAGTGTKPCRFRYEAEVAAATAGKEAANGDKCFWFSGSGSRYYVVLCDGMGTGLGASRDGETAGEMLRRLLRAGFPAEHALESLNSLCALRGRAGAVTVDLLELELDTGRATAYKWGAAPSYLLFPGGAEKIGTAAPLRDFPWRIVRRRRCGCPCGGGKCWCFSATAQKERRACAGLPRNFPAHWGSWRTGLFAMAGEREPTTPLQQWCACVP